MNAYQDHSCRKNACRSGLPLMSCPAAGISGNQCINAAPSTPSDVPCVGSEYSDSSAPMAFCPQRAELEIRPVRPCPPTNGNRPSQVFSGMGNYPVGMGYVPVQTWQQPYALGTAFRRGTIFPALDLPFMMGGAC